LLERFAVAFLLDTNVCIALINGTSEAARKKFSRAVASGELVCVSSVSLHELWYGVAKSARAAANTARLQVFLAGEVRVVEFGADDARTSGEIRNTLERKGAPIGGYDVLIAGQALSRGLTLVTANTREFARINGLLWEDWGKT
jgi:tRNA(fMet)-specific endonuclease VapC